MKYTKSKIGQIALVKFEEDLTYKEATKKVPKEARIMKAWELLKLYDEDKKSLKDVPKGEYFFTYGTVKYYRACRLSNFVFDSVFYAIDRDVDYASYRLRGVLIVNKPNAKKISK